MQLRIALFLCLVFFSPFAFGQSNRQILTLEDGQSVTSSTGIWLAAPQGLLNAPRTLYVEQVQKPVLALPDSVELLGGFYQVGSLEQASYFEDLVMGFHLPPNTNLNEVALAILIPPSFTGTQSFEWSFDGGLYDSKQNRLSLTLAALIPDGLTVALVKGSFASYNTPLPTETVETPSFRIICDGGSSCDKETQLLALQTLQRTYTQLSVNSGFPQPELRAEIIYKEQEDGSLVSLGKRYKVWLYDTCDGVLGEYFFERLSVCTEDIETMPKILVHEYFHAVQKTYKNVGCFISNCPARYWFIEGMAEASMNSTIQLMKRSERVPPLTVTWQPLVDGASDLDPITLESYASQDFWVFLGRYYFSYEGISYLQDFLEAGPETAQIDHLLKHRLGLSLGDVYWDFVKNQAYEQRIDISNTALLEEHASCTLNFQSALPNYRYSFNAASTVQEQLILKPLESKLIRVDLTSSDIQEAYRFATTVETNDADLKFKIYRDTEASCATVFENTPRYIHISKENERLYILISNTHLDKTATATVKFWQE